MTVGIFHCNNDNKLYITVVLIPFSLNIVYIETLIEFYTFVLVSLRDD